MVHWDKKKIKRLLLAQLSVLALLVVGVIAVDSALQANDALTHRLKVVRSLKLPGREISAFARAPANGAAGGQPELLAIGDSDAYLTRLPLGPLGLADTANPTQVDLGPVLRQTFSLCQSLTSPACRKQLDGITSQWEALALDGNGRIFALQEHTDSIVIFAPALDRVEGVLSFDFFHNGTIKATKQSENALAESLVLLKNGHILVAKERSPSVIVEFGPRGEQPLGFSAATVLAPGEAFAFAAPASGVGRADLVPLASWGNPDDAAACDIAELAVGVDGLHVLSQRCGTISLLPELPPREATLKPAQVWRLPKKVKFPEALVVLGAGHFLVGSDLKTGKTNTYELILK